MPCIKLLAVNRARTFRPELITGARSITIRLAKRLAKRMVMLRAPVISSGRKVRALFTANNLMHGIEAIFTAGGALKDRANCEYWYDNPVR